MTYALSMAVPRSRGEAQRGTYIFRSFPSGSDPALAFVERPSLLLHLGSGFGCSKRWSVSEMVERQQCLADGAHHSPVFLAAFHTAELDMVLVGAATARMVLEDDTTPLVQVWKAIAAG